MSSGKTGRAAAFWGPGTPFEIMTYPVPEPGPGAVVVKTTLANICGSDIKQWDGRFDLKAAGRALPQVLGHELTGRVHSLGDGVTTDSDGQALLPGDRIVFTYFNPCTKCEGCRGGKSRMCQRSRTYLAESLEVPPHFRAGFADYYYIFPGATLVKVPDHVTDRAISGANCALAQVICAMEQVGLLNGSTVLIQGCGGLGLYACAVARINGAGRVIATDVSAGRLQAAGAFGADDTINVQGMDVPAIVDTVLGLTGGRGADVIGEFTGMPTAVESGVRALALGGQLISVGSIVAGNPLSVDFGRLTLRNQRLIGVIYYEPRHLIDAVKIVSRRYEDFPWETMVSTTYSLEHLDSAFEAAARAEGAGRIGVLLDA